MLYGLYCTGVDWREGTLGIYYMFATHFEELSDMIVYIACMDEMGWDENRT